MERKTRVKGGGADVDLSVEGREQLIENLNIEVTNQRRRYEAQLEQFLEAFSLRHASELTRIPKSIRGIKLKDFDRFGGSVQACVQALARQRIAESDGEGHAKKRKWQAALLEQGQEEERASKTPRLAPASPVKPTPKAPHHHNKSRALFPKTPTRTGTNNTLSSKPTTLPYGKAGLASPTKSRPASPVKQAAPSTTTTTKEFKPASTVFNPVLPPKTPTYPRRHPRQNESVLSVNGTPLAVPPLGGGDKEKFLNGGGFIIRRDPSYLHQNPSYSMASTTSTAVSNSTASGGTGAMITVSTHRGHTIQFDPLLTSPTSLDRLPDLTDSAKKQVRDDTARIIHALGKWRL